MPCKEVRAQISHSNHDRTIKKREYTPLLRRTDSHEKSRLTRSTDSIKKKKVGLLREKPLFGRKSFFFSKNALGWGSSGTVLALELWPKDKKDTRIYNILLRRTDSNKNKSAYPQDRLPNKSAIEWFFFLKVCLEVRKFVHRFCTPITSER